MVMLWQILLNDLQIDALIVRNPEMILKDVREKNKAVTSIIGYQCSLSPTALISAGQFGSPLIWRKDVGSHPVSG